MLANGLVNYASRFLVLKEFLWPKLTYSEHVAEGGIMECCSYLLRSRSVILKGQWVPRLQEASQTYLPNGFVGYQSASRASPFLFSFCFKILYGTFGKYVWFEEPLTLSQPGSPAA